MAIYMVACPACKKEIPAIAAACKHCGKGSREGTSVSAEKRRRLALKAEGRVSQPVVNAVASRLQRYVGANWDSHYEAPFIELLNAQERGTPCYWTWNWSAALTPWWFFYRRLYLAGLGMSFLWFGFSVIVTIDSDEAQRFAAALYVGLSGFSGLYQTGFSFGRRIRK